MYAAVKSLVEQKLLSLWRHYLTISAANREVTKGKPKTGDERIQYYKFRPFSNAESLEEKRRLKDVHEVK